MNKQANILLISSTLFLLFSCGNPEESASIYKPDRIWNYSVSITDHLGNISDTFTLVKTSKTSAFFERIIRPIAVEYEYKSADSLLIKERTGVVDNEKSISLHPPREHVLEFTEVAPFPGATKKMKSNTFISYSSESDLHIQKATYFDKGRNETVDLAGKVIKQHLWVADTTTIKYQNETLFCYVLNGKNLNYIEELGEFKCTYFYNEKYGFVKWIYYPPWGDEVVIFLRDTNF